MSPLPPGRTLAGVCDDGHKWPGTRDWVNCVDIYLDAETSAAQCWDRWPGHRLQTFIAVSHKPAQLVTTRRHPIQYAINTVLFSPTPLASSTDIVQMCRSSKQQLKGEQRHMMDNQFAKLPAIVPLSRGRHVSRGAQPRHVTSHILQRRGSGG